MSRDISVNSLFFGVEQVAVEAVANLDGKERRIPVPGRKALLNTASGMVLGIVSRDYRSALGENAYAVFNTLTDIAARPPASRYFQKDRDTLEKRAGRWLKQLSVQRRAPAFDLEKFITKWDEGLASSRSFRQN